MRKHGWMLAALAALLVVTASGGAAPASTDRATARGSVVGFWAGEEVLGGDPLDPEGYWSPRNLEEYTPALWRVLAARKVPLYVNLRYKRDFGPVPPGMNPPPDGLRLVRAAIERGIPVWAWIVVPFADGYWAWEGNADLHIQALRDFRAWASANALTFQGVAIDSEPSIQETNELYDAFENDPSKLADFADKTVNPAKQRAAICTYQQLVREAHAAGQAIAAAAYPLSLDDLNDGLLALQDAIDVAGIPPRGWDAVYFMAYRTVYGSLFRVDPDSGLVASYKRSAALHLGDQGQISMGVIGMDPYDDLGEVVGDVRALATLGAKRIPIYSLELTARSFGVAGVEAVVDAGAQPYRDLEAVTATAETPGSLVIRGALAAIDEAMVAATPLITADGDGGPQLPNREPIACD